MSLESGTRLGPYEVLSAIGAGGMGEVYRARDTRLHRDVALKLLPATLAGDPQRMARFEREAQVLASLNHPNIAAVYGLEESAGQRAIVMELVEGQEVHGPLPVDEALQVARQIAEAMETAHERGIIHRDLKPANIKVTPDGVVKVLDFGLAKALEGMDESNAETRVTLSPTLPLGATQVGMVLGTAAYMAPEQAKGKTADRRADIWSFGVVLYELLTGQRLFAGETVAETLASVMKDAVALDGLPAGTPAPIRRLLQRCLERDVRRRLQSMGEARIAIEDTLAGVTSERPPATSAPAKAPWPIWLPWAVGALGLGVGAWGTLSNAPASPRSVVTRFAVYPPSDAVHAPFRPAGPHQSVSPDGRYVVFVAQESGRERALWVRTMESVGARRLDRTEGADYPFWSPDSKHIGYFAAGKLMRVSAGGGAPLTIADAPDGEGGTWFNADRGEGVILFAPRQSGPLHRVSAQGGVSTAVTTQQNGEGGHAFPQMLPDGRRVLFSVRGSQAGVYVQALGSSERTRVSGVTSRALYAPPGLLVHVREGTLLAHRFNLETLALEGEPVTIADNIRESPISARAAFSVSETGAIVYRRDIEPDAVQVRWYSRDGKAQDLVLETGAYSSFYLSPDGRKLAVTRGGPSEEADVWVKDLIGGTFSRLTAMLGAEGQEVWSPNSRHLAFVGRDQLQELWYTAVGSGKLERVPHSEGYTLLEQWTPDGQYLIVRNSGRVALIPAPVGSELGRQAIKPRVVFNELYRVDHFRVSPDGQWVAYTSEESDMSEVMVAAFPSFTARKQISLSGGSQPQWRADGRELFFHALDQRIMAVDVTLGDTLQTGPVRELFRTNPAVLSNQVYRYAATGDGQRFLLREPVANSNASTIEPIFVVTNWTALVLN